MNARIIVVDEKEMFREGFCRMLVQLSWVTSLHNYGTVEEGIEAIAATRANIFIVNPYQAGESRYNYIDMIRQLAPGIRVVILADWDDGDEIIEAVKYPINGYFSKNMSFDKFEAYLYDVMHGEYRLSESLGSVLFARLVNKSGTNELTGREKEIYRLLREGCTNKDISIRLNISVNTTRNHVANVMKKTGISRRYGFLNIDEDFEGVKR